jgi:hypothetical protein
VATLTAFVSAGPELPISAVSVVSLVFAGAPKAVPAATATAQTVSSSNPSRRRFRVFEWSFNVIPP